MNRYFEYVYSSYLRHKNKRVREFKEREKEHAAILLVCRHPLGDTVLELPLIRELRYTYPSHWITVICAPSNRELFIHCPYINEVIVYDDRSKKHCFKTNYKYCQNFAKSELAKHYYELGIVPATYMASIVDAWLIYLSGANRRLSYSEKLNPANHHEYMGVYDNFFTDILSCNGMDHEVNRNLEFISYLGGKIHNNKLEIWTSKDDNQAVKDLFLKENIDLNKLRIIVNLSTSTLSKDWPTERYIAVVNLLRKNFDLEYILIGAGDTAECYAKQFLKAVPEAHNFVNQTTILQTAEIIHHSNIYIGGDTGPAHFAAAYKLNGVVIYKVAKDIQNDMENFAKRLYPWQSPLKIIQPDHALHGCERGCLENVQHCILQIDIQTVYDVIYPIIEKQVRGKS